MKEILSVEGRSLLRRLASTPVLLAFDFDGTLAPLVEPLSDVHLRPSTRALLGRLSALYPCAIITGRGREDMLARTAGLPLRAVIGNHGMEMDATVDENPVVAAWLPVLERELAGFPGAVAERKRFSATIHYTACENPTGARDAIIAAARLLDGVRVVPGQKLINIVPAGAPHKGDALLRSMSEMGCETSIFWGDDFTDEDAFAVCDGERRLGIRVGRSEESAATHYLPGQEDMDEVLRLLSTLR